MKKDRQTLLKIMSVLLVLAVIILADHLIVNFRSKPADFFGGQGGEEGKEDKEGFYQIKQGERAFLPILNFHHIATAPITASQADKNFYLEPAEFEIVLQDLVGAGYQSVFVSEAVGYLEKKQLPDKKILAITFDDGNEDFYTTAWPILQKYKMKSSMYIMTGVKGKNWLTPEQIKELDKSGLVEIGSHTIFHPYLTRVPADRQSKELKDSKEYLEKLLNKKIEIICYPFGLYNQQIKDLAREAGYKAGLTFDQQAWQNPDDLLALSRISVYPGLEVLKFLEIKSKAKP